MPPHGSFVARRCGMPAAGVLLTTAPLLCFHRRPRLRLPTASSVSSILGNETASGSSNPKRAADSKPRSVDSKPRSVGSKPRSVGSKPRSVGSASALAVDSALMRTIALISTSRSHGLIVLAGRFLAGDLPPRVCRRPRRARGRPNPDIKGEGGFEAGRVRAPTAREGRVERGTGTASYYLHTS